MSLQSYYSKENSSNIFSYPQNIYDRSSFMPFVYLCKFVAFKFYLINRNLGETLFDELLNGEDLDNRSELKS